MSVVTLGRRLPALAIVAGLAACSGQTTGAGSFAPPAPATAQVLGRVPAQTAQDESPDAGSPRIFTANRDGGQLLGFNMSASGNATPVANVSGSQTTLSDPDALTVDKLGNLYVANDGGTQIVVFDKTANGNVAPKRTIGGSQSQLGPTEGIYADPYGFIWVTDYGNNAITAYPIHSSGNVQPTNIIQGTKTQLNSPTGIEMHDLQLYVANTHGAAVLIFANGASGNVAPAATIAGNKTLISKPFALAFDKNGRLLVADEQSGVLVFAPGATGNVKPVAHITSVNDAAGIMADQKNHIWVAEFGGNAIDEFAGNAHGNATPIKRITGSSTLLDGANYLVKD